MKKVIVTGVVVLLAGLLGYLGHLKARESERASNLELVKRGENQQIAYYATERINRQLAKAWQQVAQDYVGAYEKGRIDERADWYKGQSRLTYDGLVAEVKRKIYFAVLEKEFRTTNDSPENLVRAHQWLAANDQRISSLEEVEEIRSTIKSLKEDLDRGQTVQQLVEVRSKREMWETKAHALLNNPKTRP